MDIPQAFPVEFSEASCQMGAMRVLNNIEVGLDEDLEEKLAWLSPHWSSYRILRQSVDARRRHNVHFVYSVEVAGPGESLKRREFEVPKVKPRSSPDLPVIIGSGPAGLFAALRLVERGIPCRLFERGSESGERIKGINRYWRYGELDPRNNVCYGEGGAGLYSDGKLITRIKSPHIPYVLHRLVKFGAPDEIQFLANPHVGSDRIRRVIPKLREYLKANGCEIHFDTQITEIQFSGQEVCGVKTEKAEFFPTQQICLATGHSAEDMILHLRDQGVQMEGKSFALGLRIEHPQKLINEIQYREAAAHPKLGSANYRLAHHNPQNGVGVYSFCMCPGGYVLSSGTESDGIVVNGMSNYHRNSPFANAAIVVSIDHQKSFGDSVFKGLEFRRDLEKKCFSAVRRAGGTREIPGQRVKDFWSGRLSPLGATSSPSGSKAVALHEILPKEIADHMKKGIESFERKMPGFLSEEAHFYGVESRTSCPVRITRDPISLESLSHSGLYPCGEGAGYAGGITSAACDGIRVAEKIIEKLLGHSAPELADELEAGEAAGLS